MNVALSFHFRNHITIDTSFSHFDLLFEDTVCSKASRSHNLFRVSRVLRYAYLAPMHSRVSMVRRKMTHDAHFVHCVCMLTLCTQDTVTKKCINLFIFRSALAIVYLS